ncbi:MAG: hypothetical protein DWQ07_14180 [Chloroflexi bacterium]|nr:MAG: hypothetical protein DWQ07_14180 [Chloroflexota bacterium]
MTAVDVATLRVMVRADVKDYLDDMNKAKKKTSDWKQGVKMLGGVLGGFSAAVAVQQAIRFGQASIQASSDAEESASKFRVVFGDRAEEIEKLLGEEATAINRSGVEWMDYAATIQDTLVPLGFARDAAADMSVEVVKLAEDLASFNNLDSAKVVQDIQTAIVGNTEVLRKYGVVAQQRQIIDEAINSGLVEQASEIDANIKAQAILNLIYKGTTDAQGDAERTADSYANVQKGLEAATLDLKVALGDQLQPTMLNVMHIETELIRRMAAGTKAQNNLRRAYEDGLISLDEYRKVKLDLTTSFVSAAEAEDFLVNKTIALDRAYSIIDGSVESYDRKLLHAANTSEQMAIAQENVKGAMEELKLWVDGPVGESIEKFAEREKDLEEQAEDVRQKIDELEKQGYPSHHEKIQEQEDALADVEQQIDNNAAAHEEATKRILLDLLMQRAAMLGLEDDSFGIIASMAESWGLIDEATRVAMTASDQALLDFANGAGVAETEEKIKLIEQLARNTAGDYTINFSVRGLTADALRLQGLADFYAGGGDLPRNADGGPVFRGQPTIVGEREPEVFVPGQDGMILNQLQLNERLGGGNNEALLGEMQILNRNFDRLPRMIAKSVQVANDKGSAL